jgi:hypothetical protein
MDNLCSGCLRPSIHDVCFPCVMARHKAVLLKRCVCPKRERRPRMVRAMARQWVACDRCLGMIRKPPHVPMGRK